MKYSKYNIFKQNNTLDKYTAYNTRTNALAILTTNEYLNLSNSKNISDLEDGFITELKAGGFVIEDDVDELKVQNYATLTSCYSTENITLTIAPTTACNFDCIYCYEKKSIKDGKMSSDVQDAIMTYIKNKVASTKSLNIQWYGGEPLLQMDIIGQMTERFKQICLENNMPYSASIVTNGYLLSKTIAHQLNELSVQSMQITLDGLDEIHDARRPLVNGEGTFNKIIDNLVDISDIYQGSINLRINVDKENSDQPQSILKVLTEKKLDKRVQPYLGKVTQLNGCYLDSSCLNDQQFSALNFDFNKELIKFGFYTDLLHKYPKSRSHYCGAQQLTFNVIDPQGYIYKCWNDIGILEYAVGHISNTDFVGNQTRLFKYTLDTVYDTPECANCIILPLCMGGCPQIKIEGTKSCSEHKFMLSQYLELMSDTLVKKNAK